MSVNSRPPIDSHLTYGEQKRLMDSIDRLTEKLPLREHIFYTYLAEMSMPTHFLMYFLSWRAGFRGFNLYKFGHNRISTLLMGAPFPVNGYLSHHFVRDGMIDPFRIESPWSYAWRHALAQQLGNVACGLGPLALTFLYASKLQILPLPEGMHRPGVREIAFKMFYERTKRYHKTIWITAISSTVMMFCMGYAAYQQSRQLLSRYGMKTMSLREDTTDST